MDIGFRVVRDALALGAACLLLTWGGAAVAEPPATSPGAQPSPPSCPSACDAACAVCCKSWSIRATCADGKHVAHEGAFATWMEAKTAAESASSTRKVPCDGDGGGWSAFCAIESRSAPPSAPPHSSQLLAHAATLQAQVVALDETRRSFTRFATDRLLLTRAERPAATLAETLHKTREEAFFAREEAKRLVAKDGASADEVKALVAAHQPILQRVTTAMADTKAFIADPAIIDAAAEARAKAIADAEAAMRARTEAMARSAEDAQRRAQAAIAQAKADQEERVRRYADAQTRARLDEEARRAAAARAIVDAQARQAAELEAQARLKADQERRAKLEEDRRRAETERQRQEAAHRSEGEAATRVGKEFDDSLALVSGSLTVCSRTIATLTMQELDATLSPAQKSKASESKGALSRQKTKLQAVLVRIRMAKTKTPASAALAELQAAHKDAIALDKETAALVAASR